MVAVARQAVCLIIPAEAELRAVPKTASYSYGILTTPGIFILHKKKQRWKVYVKYVLFFPEE